MTQEIYHLQNCRTFSLDSRDIKYFIGLIETELKRPRKQRMLDYSFATLWLYGEQILLLTELGELTDGPRRNRPQVRGVKAGNENVYKAIAGAG
jgi:hypothetical protein